MEKIPTIFERDWDGDPSLVTAQGTPALDECLKWDVVATVKWDGTACMVRDGMLFKRYTLKRGKKPPAGFEPTGEPDAKTGKQPGWVPVGDGPEDAAHREAFIADTLSNGALANGTYELLGPKVQGNPYGMDEHTLTLHGKHQFTFTPEEPCRSYWGLRQWFEKNPFEGIVYWRNGKPVGKIKRRDFGLPWPP